MQNLIPDIGLVTARGRVKLKSVGYEVETASDGEEAIKMYKEAKSAGDGFDVVIMDLTVPGRMGGKEAIFPFWCLR